MLCAKCLFMDNASSYLSILLNDIEQTKNYLSAYNNQLLFLQAKYPAKDLDDNMRQSAKVMADAEKIALVNTIGMFRTYATRAYVGFNSIQEKFNVKSSSKITLIKDSYHKIKTVPMPDYEDCENFVQALSDISVNEINVQALINTQEKANALAQASETPDID